MSLAKTAFYGILILAFALLLDLLLFVKLARADEQCPQVWAVVQAPDTVRPGGPPMTQFAESFDHLSKPNCDVERFADNGLYLHTWLTGDRLTVIATMPFETICTAAVPCYVVVGVRTGSCAEMLPRLVYADGASESRTTVRRIKATPGAKGEVACESETYVYGYITAPRAPATPRQFAATIDLK